MITVDFRTHIFLKYYPPRGTPEYVASLPSCVKIGITPYDRRSDVDIDTLALLSLQSHMSLHDDDVTHTWELIKGIMIGYEYARREYSAKNE